MSDTEEEIIRRHRRKSSGSVEDVRKVAEKVNKIHLADSSLESRADSHVQGIRRDEDTENSKTILREQSARLLKHSQYSEALNIIKELQSLEEDVQLKIEVLTDLAVCQIMTERPHADTIQQIVSLTTELSLFDKAEKLLNNCEYVKSFVLYECEGIKYCRFGYRFESHEAFNRVRHQIYEIYKLMRKRGRLRKVATQTLLQSAERMIEYAHGIENADIKILAEARCMNLVGLINNDIGHYEVGMAVGEKAVQLMERHFRVNAVEYSVFRALLNNLGVCKENVGDFSEAHRLYQRSLDAGDTTKDYLSDELKQKEDSITRSNVDRMLEKLSSLGPEEDSCNTITRGTNEGESLLELKEKAEQLISDQNYTDAKRVSQELVSREADDWSKFDTYLALLECEAMTRREFGVYFNEFYALCKTLEQGGEDLEAISDDCVVKEEWVRAFILCHSAVKFHVLSPDKLQSVDSIVRCVEKMNEIVEAMAKVTYLRNVAPEQVIKSMYEALECFKEIKQVDHEIIATRVGLILWRISRSYMSLEQHEKQYLVAKEGSDYMEKHLGSLATKSRFYAFLFFDQGLSLKAQELYHEATLPLKHAASSILQAEDAKSQKQNAKVIRDNFEWCERMSKKYSSQKKSRSAKASPKSVTYNVFQPGSSYVETATEYNTVIASQNIRKVKLASNSGDSGTSTTSDQTAIDQPSFGERSGAIPKLRVGEKKSFPELDLPEVTLAGDGVYFDENQRLRAKYRVFRGVLDGIKPEKVAVKIIESDITDETLLREPVNLCNLAPHPNVLLYRKSGKFRYLGISSVYLATEICDTNTLYEKVLTNKLTQENKMKILRQCTEGLKHVHDNDIAHRDLKPQNVLIALKTGDAKIGDFGFSKEILRGRSVISQSSTRRGTDGWSAPETYEDGRINPKLADIYSLGLLIYFVLSDGKHAYGEKYHDWSYNIRHDQGFNISQLDCTGKSVANELILQMLRRDPATRPTVDEVLQHQFFRA